VTDLLGWLQGSALGQTMRGAGVWAYAIVNLAHITGVASLFGSILLIDLRLLGIWRATPLAALSGPATRIAGLGFALAALSGLCMLATNGREYVGNPFLPIKFGAIGLGLVNVLLLRRSRAWREHHTRELSAIEQRTLRVAGGLSLLCWTIALTAGRMIGYW